MAAVSHRAIKELAIESHLTFQSQVLIFNSAFELKSRPPSLAYDFSDSVSAAASLLSCTCTDGISNNEASTIYSQGHISKLGPTCESQIEDINCHADDFWVHRAHAYNTNLQLSWYKKPRNRRELSFCWELQSFHQSHWKNKFPSCQRMQATLLPCSSPPTLLSPSMTMTGTEVAGQRCLAGRGLSQFHKTIICKRILNHDQRPLWQCCPYSKVSDFQTC